MTDAPPPWWMPEVLGLLWSEVDLPRRTARLTDTKTGALLTHSITSRYMHSADAVLLAVANATMRLMASDQAQPQCGISDEMKQSCGTNSPR